VSLLRFAAQSDDCLRESLTDLAGVQNARKALETQLEGLLNEDILRAKLQAEVALLGFITDDPERKERYGMPRQDISDALTALRTYHSTYYLLESQRSPFGQLFDLARDLVRIAANESKPDAYRLPGYRGATLARVRQRLSSENVVNRDLERVRLRDGLTMLARVLGGQDRAVATALRGLSPQARAAELVDGTRVDHLEFRRQLLSTGFEAINECEDPMIRFAASMEPFALAAGAEYDAVMTRATADAYARIAEATRELTGNETYPDANGTLRISLGTVAGYEDDGRPVGAVTTVGGLYELAARRAGNTAYRLPQRWLDAKGRLDPELPFNFVCTNDIAGGSSGSPIIGGKGELVGLVFDGNHQSLTWDFAYDDRQGRAIGVDARAILEILRAVYGADRLVAELSDARR
jgi:hypothetical protein